jgi:hypothetical protein
LICSLVVWILIQTAKVKDERCGTERPVEVSVVSVFTYACKEENVRRIYKRRDFYANLFLQPQDRTITEDAEPVCRSGLQAGTPDPPLREVAADRNR